MQRRLDLMETRTMNSITEQSQNMRRLMADLVALFILGFQMVYQIGGELKQTSLFILSIGSTIYTELSGLHSLFTRLESSISEEYFTLQDAIGRTLPIHLRTIASWEDLGYIIQRRFEGMKGGRRVARHQYALEDHASRKELNQSMPWDHAFRPYQKVNMSILCKDSLDTPGEVSKRSCPWCRHLASGEESVEIKWYIPPHTPPTGHKLSGFDSDSHQRKLQHVLQESDGD